jgi:hypothetical protein
VEVSAGATAARQAASASPEPLRLLRRLGADLVFENFEERESEREIMRT